MIEMFTPLSLDRKIQNFQEQFKIMKEKISQLKKKFEVCLRRSSSQIQNGLVSPVQNLMGNRVYQPIRSNVRLLPRLVVD